MSSIFTRIINREIPASIVYEDDICIAILDINPVQKWHTLVIPKQELEWMDDYDDATIAHCMVIAKNIMKHQKHMLAGLTHVYLVVEGLEVPHRHIHLIPSYEDTPQVHWPHVTYAQWETESYCNLLKLQH